MNSTTKKPDHAAPGISVMTMRFSALLEAGALKDTALLDALAGAGFDGIEAPSAHFRGRPQLLDDYQAYLADSSLAVTCIDGGCNFVAVDRAGREGRAVAHRAGVQNLHWAIEVAATLEAPMVLAAGSRLVDGIAPADGRGMIIEGLHACLPSARAAGITLAIEDFGVAPALQCAAADCLEILEAVPDLAFIFDTGNFYFAGEDPLDAWAALSHKARYAHLKDWVKSDTPEIADVAGCPLGAGFIPNHALVRHFVASGAMDTLSIEIGAPGDPLEAARRDLLTLRSWIETAKAGAAEGRP